MSTKFSKGPWKTEEVANNCIAILNENDDEIAQVLCEEETTDRERADASLIAAAPELFEVLSAAVAQARSAGAHFLDGKGTPNLPAWVTDAQEVLEEVRQ